MTASLQINRELCLNSNYSKVHCELCRQICPLDCVSSETFAIDEKRCNDCGLCQAVCPAEAIFSTTYTGRSVERWLETHPVSMDIFCQYRDKSSPWPCLGFLNDRLLLVFAAGKRKVAVDNLACSSCKPGVGSYLQNAIQRTNTLLRAKDELLIGQGKIDCENSRTPKTVSRRDFFSQLFGAAVDTVREVVQPAADISENLPQSNLFQRYARQGFLSPEIVEQQIFSGFMINADLCQACGLCVKICPQHALDAKEIDGVLHFFHDPLLCTNCEVCVSTCPRKAASLTNTCQLNRQETAEIPLPRCNCCGQLFQPLGDQNKCFECLLKGR